MSHVTGIGGVFFPAKDPEALSAWYAEHLGVLAPPTDYGGRVWMQEAGATVFAPMAADSPFFTPGSKLWINFRVDDLQALCAELESSGIAVDRDPEEYPNGVFASLLDPEGNQIQLWEPRGVGLD